MTLEIEEEATAMETEEGVTTMEETEIMIVEEIGEATEMNEEATTRKIEVEVEAEVTKEAVVVAVADDFIAAI